MDWIKGASAMSWFNFYGLLFVAAILVPNILFAMRHREGFENLWQNKTVETRAGRCIWPRAARSSRRIAPYGRSVLTGRAFSARWRCPFCRRCFSSSAARCGVPSPWSRLRRFSLPATFSSAIKTPCSPKKRRETETQRTRRLFWRALRGK